MNTPELSKALGLILLSSVKLLFAPGASLAAGFSVGQTILVTSIGGCTGVTSFFYFGNWVMVAIRKWHFRLLHGTRSSAVHKEKKTRSTKRRRAIVRLKTKYGVVGLAILTPAIISIPIGAVVAARYYFHNKWMLPLLLISTLCWSTGLTFLAYAVKQNILGWQ